ncbi:LysR substrate-binding domain-containing protein [Achromobacter denitrificans]
MHPQRLAGEHQARKAQGQGAHGAAGRRQRFPERRRALHDHPAGNLNVNHPEVTLDAVVAGAGIARMASFIAEAAVMDGRLKLVLTDWIAPGTPVQLVYLPNRHLSPRIRAFVDAMAEALLPWQPRETAMGL